MRGARSKAARKSLAIYQQFGFRTPYQVLVDDEFCRLVVSQKIDARSRLEKLLAAPVKLMITQCCMEHLYADGKEGAEAIRWAKESAERRKCNHWQTKASADECIAGIIGDDNRYRYVVASQSYDLRATLRLVAGVPIVYLNPRSVLLLEPPSDATIARRQNLEQSKLHVPVHELEAIASKSGNVLGAGGPIASTSAPSRGNAPKTVEQVLGKRKRSAKGPNPLSVKKKAAAPKPSASKKRQSADAQPAPTLTEPVGTDRQSAVIGIARDAAATATTTAMRKRRKRGRRAGAGANGSSDATVPIAGDASGDDD